MTTHLSDEPRDVRDEDAFDVGAVHAWLQERVDGLGDEPPDVRQFAVFVGYLDERCRRIAGI